MAFRSSSSTQLGHFNKADPKWGKLVREELATLDKQAQGKTAPEA